MDIEAQARHIDLTYRDKLDHVSLIDSARLRVTLSAAHERAHIDRLIETLRALL